MKEQKYEQLVELFSMTNPAMMDCLYEQYKNQLKTRMMYCEQDVYEIKTNFKYKYQEQFENLYQWIKEKFISEGLICVEYGDYPNTSQYLIGVNHIN